MTVDKLIFLSYDLRMIPRGKLDIGWSDLCFAVLASLRTWRRRTLENELLATWGNEPSIVCFSVRSGFDLALQALQLPPGSEVLVSAVTIPGMVQILEHHGLVPVPVDLDIDTAGVSLPSLEQRLSKQSRAILIAHLFGSRMVMDELVAFAQRNNLLLFEDCAQAYDGADFRGHPNSDVVMFSFGTIKTHTALGGGILCVRDANLLQKMSELHHLYSVQSRWGYLKRVLRTSLLLILSDPVIFGSVVALLRLLCINHDELLSKVVRGFPGGAFFERIRQQPCTPLLAMLNRRLRTKELQRIEHRIAIAEMLVNALPTVRRPAQCAQFHQHWVVPMLSRSPDELIQRLWQAGFDATRKASTMSVVCTAQYPSTELPQATAMVEQTVYLPNHPSMNHAKVEQLAQIVRQFEAETQSETMRKK